MSKFALPEWLVRFWQRTRVAPGAPSVLLGVLLPLVAIAFELITGMCESLLFDPMPTFVHIALVLSVPLFNWLVWSSYEEDSRWPGLVKFGHGFAIGVSCAYTIAFLPILPIAVVGVLFYGLGILPWSATLALIVSMTFWFRRRAAAAKEGGRYRVWPGVLTAFLALTAADAPSTLTRIGVGMATSTIPDEQLSGIQFLRAVGSEDVLLRMCYVRNGRSTDMVSLLFGTSHTSTEQAREIFYRVTGEAFNARPAPVAPSNRHRWFGDDGFAFDTDQGMTGVGGRVEGLSLLDSQFDGSIDANAALGYLEWTMVVKNDSNFLREARAEIGLPPGAVVSRLTLWVNGEEREAAFAARGQVTEAYQRVVQQRRDPVLVTTAGEDRISVQMFPIPASGEMKIRIGLTVPLSLTDLDEGTLQLPYFHAHNFLLPTHVSHRVWIESKSALRTELNNATTTDAATTIRTTVSSEQLETNIRIHAARAGNTTTWSLDPHSADHLIKQTLWVDNADAPRRTVIVVDGSQAMRPFARPLAEAIGALSADTELYVLFASDDRQEPVPVKPSTAAELVRNADYVGGHDNTATLAQALDLAMPSADSVLIWVHGPQPLLLQTSGMIEQRLQRGGTLPAWYDVQVMPGSNLLARELERMQPMRVVAWRDFPDLLESFKPRSHRVRIARERVSREQAPTMSPEGLTSAHLVRLWARDEVSRLLYAAHPMRPAAIDLAARYQLVTPLTGAVVLETQAQYDAAGLTPVPEGTVPSIPEPEEWALIAVALAMLLWAWSRRPREPPHARA